MDIELRLSTSVALLQQLGNTLSDLVNSSPDVFNDPAIASRLRDFRQAHETATQRLINPSLSIATFGTTSSGKSTIVNALMGRRIAPIEVGKMSGGVLTLRHSEEQKFIIEATADAAWETGEWSELSDEELYHKIQVVMNTYHRCS
jgi:replication fork clamp-binding protein CrfC